MTNTDTILASRGAGALAYRLAPTRPMHLAVADAMRVTPGADIAQVRAGWYAERAEAGAGWQAMVA